MRGLDTNVLLRLLLDDEPGQTAAAESAIGRDLRTGERPVVCLLALLETEWVLRKSAGLGRDQIVAVFLSLLEKPDLAIEHESVVEDAVHAYQNSSADFADCLINARYRSLGCASMLTFDMRAAKLPGAELLTGDARAS